MSAVIFLLRSHSFCLQAGWTGEHCEIPQCRPGCGLTGTCVRPDVCSCQPGYTGARCQQAVCHPPCHIGGTCVKPFTCHCPPGRSGRFCQKLSCPLNCQNGGRCNHNLTTCLCRPHYYGDFCQKRSDLHQNFLSFSLSLSVLKGHFPDDWSYSQRMRGSK